MASFKKIPKTMQAPDIFRNDLVQVFNQKTGEWLYTVPADSEIDLNFYDEVHNCNDEVLKTPINQLSLF